MLDFLMLPLLAFVTGGNRTKVSSPPFFQWSSKDDFVSEYTEWFLHSGPRISISDVLDCYLDLNYK